MSLQSCANQARPQAAPRIPEALEAVVEEAVGAEEAQVEEDRDLSGESNSKGMQLDINCVID